WPVINWMSFAGTADVAMWGYRRFRELPWEHPDKWLRHSSLMYASNVTTPTLLMTGALDLRTPMSQTEEYYQALKMERVPTAMIRFRNEWHGTSRTPSNFLRTQLFLRSWFERFGTHDDGDHRAVSDDDASGR
ncbi:MAG: prolyl oligopeptidase family serine peptidase, partial [Gemmatimonadetes bacterium]|nr:prolyl oligopeptidase family serine peptidase [Gemmatimonadota bacterium]